MHLDLTDRTHGQGRVKNPTLEWFHARRRLDLIFGGIAALLVLLGGVYWIGVLNSPSLAAGSPLIHFEPKDVVYGVPYHAVHAMGSGSSQADRDQVLQSNGGAARIQRSATTDGRLGERG